MFTRKSTRAICIKGNLILCLYTKRYDDYSLPGGGLDQGEDIIEGLKRELREETGAQNIQEKGAFGIYEEYRPWYKNDYDVQHMISYCHLCSIDEELGEHSHEAHEISNKMTPLWIPTEEAIAHNKKTIDHSEKKGMSIKRETFLMEQILEELIK